MNRRLKLIASGVRERLEFTKRQQFVCVTLLLTGALIATQLLSDSFQIELLLLLFIGAYILSALVLRQDLKGWEFVTLLTLPAFYTGAVYLFYLLLPTRWLTRLPIAILYAIGMYAILLTENIFNVAAQRSIQLLRAAHSVGFLLTLVTVFFLIDTVVSLHLPYYLNGILTFVIILPLTLQALWSMELMPAISPSVWLGTWVITLLLTELATIISFWPIRTTIAALFVTTVFYTLVGMTQQQLVGRLFTKTAREFMTVLVIVFILLITTTKWGTGGS